MDLPSLQGQRQHAVQTAISELREAIKFLGEPPKEAFTDLTGAPQQPDDAQGATAKHWQQTALNRLKRMQHFISTLAAHDSLPDLGADAAKQEQTATATVGPCLAPSSFWSDIRIAAGSGSRETPSAANKAGRAANKGAALQGPQNGHAGPGECVLIEELDSGAGSQVQETEKLQRGGVIIEELTNEENIGGLENGAERIDKEQVVRVVLVCALHSQDAALDAPWASGESSAAVMSVLAELARSMHYPDAGRSRDPSRLVLALDIVQAMIVDLLPAVLRMLGEVIYPAQLQEKNAHFQAYKGPDAFERAKAAQQLAWLVRRLKAQALHAALGPALPCVQAAATDPSPAVQAQGMWALHHISQEALPADLRAHGAELSKLTVKSLVACDERTWPAAASAACRTAVTLHGSDIFGEGYRAVMGEMLTQGANYSHVPARRLVWLTAMMPLLKALGLATVRFFSRLLPLLLEWLHASDTDTRLQASQALGLVLMQTWPRVPAHAQLVWDHLAEEYNATAASIPQLRHSHGDGKGFSSEPHHNCSPVSEDSIEDGTGSKSRLNGNSSESKENVLRAIVKAAEVLWRTGGKAFQEQMQQRTSENQNALLQSVVSVQNC